MEKAVGRQVSERSYLSVNGESGKTNIRGNLGLQSLHYAAWYNMAAAVDTLIRSGADIMAKDSEGATPLHYAARYKHRFSKKQVFLKEEGSRTVINSLVQAGVDINAQDMDGYTPLFFAVLRGNKEAVQELLKHPKMFIDVSDKRGQTSMHLAAKYNRESIARSLLESGAKVLADDCGFTPVHLAAMEGNISIIEIILEKKNVMNKQQIMDMEATDGTSILDLAIENGRNEIVQLCLEHGSRVRKTCRAEGISPIHLAASTGVIPILELLLDHDDSLVDMRTTDQRTPLHWAAGYGKTEVADFLIKRGAELNAEDHDGYTPLHVAAIYGSCECLDYLLDAGADVDALSKRDQSAVHLAAINNKTATLSKLLSHLEATGAVGRLISSDDRIGNSPLHYAAMYGFFEIAKILLKHNADLENKNEDEAIPLHIAAANGRTRVVREILEATADPTIVLDEDEDGNSPLHLAAANGHTRACELFIEKGATIRQRNRFMWTPLCAAAVGGWTDTIRVLLRAGADHAVIDRKGNTPVHLAAKAGHARVVRLLIKHGASMESTNLEGSNPLDLAISHRQKDVAMTIISSDQWKQALRNRTPVGPDGSFTTPLRKLALNMPDVAEQALSRCISYPETADLRDQDLKLTFDFEFIEDIYTATTWGDEKLVHIYSHEKVYDKNGNILKTAQPSIVKPSDRASNHVLKCLARSKRAELLYHPLILAVVRHKWRLAQFSFIFYLFYYAFFVAIVTAYMSLSTPPYMLNNTWLEQVSSEHCQAMGKSRLIDSLQTLQPHESKAAGILIWCLAGFGMLIEAVQFSNVGLHYLHDLINMLDWFTYIAWCVTVLPLHPCHIRTDWQWQLGAVAILSAWLNLILFLRRLPYVGIYYVMVGQVFITSIKFFIFCFSLFILAFAVTFFVLLRNQPEFSDLGLSFVKVFVMMIGELEYTGVFHNVDHPVAHRTIAVIIFLIFLCMVTIVIMNLLTGLAVGDVESVQNVAMVKKIIMQIDLILEVEIALTERLRRYFKTSIPSLTLRPNKVKFKLYHKLAKFMVGPLDSQSIAKAVFKPTLDHEGGDLAEKEETTETTSQRAGGVGNRGGAARGTNDQRSGLTNQDREKMNRLEDKINKVLELVTTILQRQDEAWQMEDNMNDSQ